MRTSKADSMARAFKAISLAMVLSASTVLPAAAAWQPSVTQQEVGVVDAEVTTESGETVTLEITTETKTEEDGTVVDVAESTDVWIKVTPVSQTQEANDAIDADEETYELAYSDKSGLTTDSGLKYSTNDSTNLVYATVTGSTSTTEFLEKVSSSLLQKVQEAVSALNETHSVEDTVDDYSPLALFDVTASAGAMEVLGTNGSVKISLEVDGVKEDSRLVVIHFNGDLTDAEREAAWEALNTDFDTAMLNYDAEILESTPGDGVVTVTMTSFSPVLILARTEEETTTEEDAVVEEETTVHDGGATGDNSNLMTWLVVLVIVGAALVGMVVYTRKKKA